MRVLLTLEYDGTAYVGWQRQLNGASVQGVLEAAVSRVLKAPIVVVGASRTDAGVHALGQRAHFDSQSNIPIDKYPYALNALLPPDIRVTDAQLVPDHFHARFDASGKQYTYRIYNRRHANALNSRFCAHVPIPLDIRSMAEAATALVGRHDFSAFAAAGGSAKTFVRELTNVSAVRDGDLITFSVEGTAFLYNMVRIIAGTLIYIGQGKLPISIIAQAFSSRQRTALGPTAPAHGLELTRVWYERLR